MRTLERFFILYDSWNRNRQQPDNSVPPMSYSIVETDTISTWTTELHQSFIVTPISLMTRYRKKTINARKYLDLYWMYLHLYICFCLSMSSYVSLWNVFCIYLKHFQLNLIAIENSWQRKCTTKYILWIFFPLRSFLTSNSLLMKSLYVNSNNSYSYSAF